MGVHLPGTGLKTVLFMLNLVQIWRLSDPGGESQSECAGFLTHWGADLRSVRSADSQPDRIYMGHIPDLRSVQAAEPGDQAMFSKTAELSDNKNSM